MLNRLENKGTDPETNIIKLSNVRVARIKIGLKLKTKLDMGHDGSYVMDSSFVIGARRIEKWLLERKVRKA